MMAGWRVVLMAVNEDGSHGPATGASAPGGGLVAAKVGRGREAAGFPAASVIWMSWPPFDH